MTVYFKCALSRRVNWNTFSNYTGPKKVVKSRKGPPKGWEGSVTILYMVLKLWIASRKGGITLFKHKCSQWSAPETESDCKEMSSILVVTCYYSTTASNLQNGE